MHTFSNTVRTFILAGALAASLLTAGCTTIPDPVVAQERVQAKALPIRNVLLVVDYRLDVQAMPGRAERLMADMYSNVGNAMAEAVTAAGGRPTVVYVRHSDDLPTATQEYSHVWAQRITRLTGMGDGYLSRDRLWRTSIAHRAAPGAPLTPAYEAQYVADGVVCFTHVAYGNKEECRQRFRAAVAAQLHKYQQAQ